MSIFKWSDSYSVGVVEIDNQHKGLVKLLNDLFDAMSVGKANVVLGGILDQLIRYAQLHFATEEKYFDQFDFEFSEEHKIEHQRFAEEVVEFKKGFDKGSIVMSIDVYRFLKDWLINHMNGEDQKYKECFQKNGLR